MYRPVKQWHASSIVDWNLSVFFFTIQICSVKIKIILKQMYKSSYQTKFLPQKIQIWRATVLNVNVIFLDYAIIPELSHCEFCWLHRVFAVYAIKDITKIIINTWCKTISNRPADTVVCYFSLLYRWLKEATRVIRNYIRDVMNYLKKRFSLDRGICLVPWYLLRLIPRYTESPRTMPLRWGKSGKK